MIEDPEAVSVTTTNIKNYKTCWNYVFDWLEIWSEGKRKLRKKTKTIWSKERWMLRGPFGSSVNKIIVKWKSLRKKLRLLLQINTIPLYLGTTIDVFFLLCLIRIKHTPHHYTTHVESPYFRNTYHRFVGSKGLTFIFMVLYTFLRCKWKKELQFMCQFAAESYFKKVLRMVRLKKVKHEHCWKYI